MSQKSSAEKLLTPLWVESRGFAADTNDERLVQGPDFDGVSSYVLDVPETISQLGYGSHQFFRYYGKFPSVVGREIVKRFPSDGPIIDSYVGSGTTLVEAQISGRRSLGIDINPLAVLASEVKTKYYDYAALEATFNQAISLAGACGTPWAPSIDVGRLNKWFSDEAILSLGKLRWSIDQLPQSDETDFLIVAFLAIVRRCSNAFDGEVRPHINRQKRPKSPFKAFSSKFREMINGLTELDSMRPESVLSTAVLGDNRNESSYARALQVPATLVVAHPPYLNSFNYLAAFSLEFIWGENLDRLWRGWTQKEIRALEHKAHPATDANLTRAYYEDFFQMAHTVRNQMAVGGVLAVVVGDATIRGALEPVHQKIWDGLKSLEFKPLEIWFRTTHYGIGKYAYADRADYHGEAEKRDAIMFLSS